MTVLAFVRPDSWNFPLFVHVLGAMILVGGLLAGAACLAFARGDARYLRLGYWSLLAVSLPGWLIMRVGAEWIASKEGWTKKGVPTPTWLDIGFLLADLGGLILLVSLIVGGVGVRRLRSGARGRPAAGDARPLGRPARGLRRRGLGDGRQALVRERTAEGPRRSRPLRLVATGRRLLLPPTAARP